MKTCYSMFALASAFVLTVSVANADPRPVQKERPIEASTYTSPKLVSYSGPGRSGDILIDTPARKLYQVLGNGQARQYSVAVGRPRAQFSGTYKISRKAEWPSWTPTSNMRKKLGLSRTVKGGPKNPLGARALYIGNTLYRIHGTNNPSSIGKAVSAGCIRMQNEDVIALYKEIGVGATVKVIR